MNMKIVVYHILNKKPPRCAVPASGVDTPFRLVQYRLAKLLVSFQYRANERAPLCQRDQRIMHK